MFRLFILSIFLLLPSLGFAKANSGSRAVSLRAKLSQSHLQVNTPTQLWSSLTIKAKNGHSSHRAPLNLSIVIDRSTSMRGEKFNQAKLAARTMIAFLDSSDRISIVSYGSDVTLENPSLLATAANKELLENAVLAIELGGSTNLSGGYKMGKKLVLEKSADHTVNRVILLSDGIANVGLRSVSELGALAREGLNNGVSLTTVGLGLDYHEDIMTEMAKEGAGNYHFVDNADHLVGFFRKEFKGLASTIARKAKVVITTSPGVELLEVKGFKSRTKGQKTTINLSEFYSLQRKDILIRLAVSPRKMGKTLIATVAISYHDVENDEKKYALKQLWVQATKNRALAKKKDRNVMKRVQQLENAKAFVSAMNAQEKGDFKKAEEIISKQTSSNQHFQHNYDFEDDISFRRVNKELRNMKKSARKPASSKKAKRLRKEKKARAFEMEQDAALF